jgi:hypothetical protein
VTACESCGQPQDDEAYLCGPCTDTARQQLAAFPHLYRQLAEELLPLGSNWPRQGGGHGTRVDAPLPVVEHPLVLRAGGGIVGVLEDWRAALDADRGLPAPVLRPGVEPRVHAAVEALLAALPWIAAAWPQAGTFAGEIAGLYREVTSIVAPPVRDTRIGYCPAVHDGVWCGAVLRLKRGADTITCPWCEASYPERLWMWLREVQDQLVNPPRAMAG